MQSGQLRWNGKIHPTLIIFASQKSRAPDDYPTVARISSALRPFDGFPRMSRAFFGRGLTTNNELLLQRSEDIH